MAKYFLNESILGGSVGDSNSREFHLVGTGNITSPDYQSKYLEAFPTVWAAGYAFRKLLENGDETARKEWAALFLLYEFGVIELSDYDQKGLAEENFWLAISDTYPPRQQNELPALRLLQVTGEPNTVVGAYYSDVVFFPSRGREKWQKSKKLKPYLDDECVSRVGCAILAKKKLKPYLDDEGQISWEKCAKQWLVDAQARQRIHLRLRQIARWVIPSDLDALKGKLNKFCQDNFGYSSANTLIIK